MPSLLRHVIFAGSIAFIGLLSACAPKPIPAADFIDTPFPGWTEDDGFYRVYPGDAFDVIVHGAPDLSRAAIVAPDGRLSLPLIAPVLAADRTIEEIQTALAVAYEPILINNRVDLAPTGFAAQQIFVGGEVNQPGVYPLPGEIGALQAVLIAGGFTDFARAKEVIILRRGRGGIAKLRLVNLSAETRGASADAPIALQRFDIVIVPRTAIGNVNVFVRQYIRDALPFEPSFSYAFGNFN